MIFWSAQKLHKNTFFHPPSPFPSNFCNSTATVVAFVLLHNSRFNFHCYTQCEATPTQKSARECAATSCDILHERLQSTFTLANQLRRITQYRHVTANCFQWRLVHLVKRHVSTPMYNRGLVVQTNTSCPPPKEKGCTPEMVHMKPNHTTEQLQLRVGREG